MNKWMIVAASTLAFACVETVRAEEAAAENNEPPAETEKPKKKPRKEAEYKSWEKASAVAEAWEQPVVAFVGIQGDKISSRFRTMTVGHPVFKELIAKNAVYYTCLIPQVKSKNPGKGRDLPAKPDFAKIKDSERPILSRLITDKTSLLPVIALFESNGKLIGTLTPDPNLSLASFIEGFKTGLESGKYPIEITRKAKKLMEADAKKRAAEEKRRRK